MRCPAASGKQEVVIDYCAGSLDERSTALLEGHMSECAACSNLVAAQRSLWSALDSFDEVEVSPDFNRRLYARIADDEANRSPASKWLRSWAARWSPFSWRPVVPVAAACATIAAALLLQPPVPPTLRTAAEPQVQAQSIDADQVERALDDLEMLKQLGVALSDNKTGSM